MDFNTYLAGENDRLRQQEDAARNERFLGECLKKIRAATDAGEGLANLLKYLGESLECDRVYVFEEIDRQHIYNTYEWCREGIPSGIEQLPYLAKKDLFPWYKTLAMGRNIIEPDVEALRHSDPLIYEFLKPQEIRTIILSPLLSQGRITGLLGADNPPPEKMAHISILFDVLAYFVCSLLSQRELQKLRELRSVQQRTRDAAQALDIGKTILLIDDSPALLKCNERVLRPQGYRILSAGTLQKARAFLAETKPDAIVLDIDLPDGNGIDFCRELQGNIPVVFLTARSDEQAARESIQAGGSAFLTKPYQVEDLQAAVAKAVSGDVGQKSAPGRKAIGLALEDGVIFK